MEAKFRKKGNVITQWVSDLPKEIIVPEGFEGIDLTGYSVISIRGGKHVSKVYIPEARKKFPNSVIVYDFSYTNGFGSGINLPENINLSKLKFYKTEEQVKKEKEETQRSIMMVLSQEILSNIPGVKTRIGYYNDYVEVVPDQEAFSSWEVKVKSLEEAITKVREIMPLWKEWNERALEAYMRLSGKENPGNGNINVYPSPLQNKIVKVRYQDFPNSRWVTFEKQLDGSWTELKD